MKSDIEIAHSIPMLPITQVADTLGIDREYTECYGKYKAKINLDFLKDHSAAGEGRLVLVTAITPTPAGEGKTTTTIGLADALRRIGKKSVVAIREPSLGPVFGIKGGAAGGGYAQVVPMEDINLHFTGDFHAIGAANNLLAAMLDNHIQQGNELGIDPRRIVWKRCVDMNDRQLRHITDGLGGKANGVPREDGFDITVASEVMAVFCMADSLTDLKKRLGSMIVAYRYDDSPVTASMLKAEGAMTALLKDAFMPNLVQTLEGTPAFVHGGPFANIAHGCNSVIATQTALQAADYVITEAGFGADLGAEKFLDIKCRKMGVRPFCVVMVATIRALKMHGGLMLNELAKEDISALKNGMCNLFRHVDNIRNVYGLPCVVAVNRFPGDTENEIKCLLDECGRRGIDACLSEIWEKGGEGGLTLADYVLRYEKKYSAFHFCYEQDDPLEEKLNKLVTRIYHGTTVCYTSSSMKQLAAIKKMGFDKLPVCVAKTQYSFSDDAARRGSPEDFSVTVTNLRVSAGAGFIVASMGDIMTMPGLPKHPAAEKIDIDENGIISGLF